MSSFASRRIALSLAWIAAIFISALVAAPHQARALDVIEFTTPKGITAWLVEKHSVPIVSMQFSFRGGAIYDPQDRLGLSGMLASTLTEGAGDLTSQAYQAAVENEVAAIGFAATLDQFSGSFRVLNEGRDRAFELLRLALQEPRFDQDALERTRTSMVQSLQYNLQDPQFVAGAVWMQLAFGDGPYSRLAMGTYEGLAAITADDLRAFAGRVLTRDGLDIVIVGDIDRETASDLIDKTFGGLPETGGLEPLTTPSVATGPVRSVIEVDIPQTYIIFGHEGIGYEHPDLYPTMVMMHVLGGGTLTSRLNEEVRIKRGLSYGIWFADTTYRNFGLMYGETSTQNARAGETVAVIDQEVARMASEGPTEAELEDAQLYLTGSYALTFGTGLQTAQALLSLKMGGRDADFVNRRNDLVSAVTIDDVRRVAREHLRPGALLFAIVGRPEGLPPIASNAAPVVRAPAEEALATRPDRRLARDRAGCASHATLSVRHRAPDSPSAGPVTEALISSGDTPASRSDHGDGCPAASRTR